MPAGNAAQLRGLGRVHGGDEWGAGDLPEGGRALGDDHRDGGVTVSDQVRRAPEVVVDELDEIERLAALDLDRLDLGIVEQTVKYHRARIMERMQARTAACHPMPEPEAMPRGAISAASHGAADSVAWRAAISGRPGSCMCAGC